MFTLLVTLLIPAVSAAQPHRTPPPKPALTELSPGRSDAVVVVKLAEGVVGEPTLDGAEIRPLFSRSPQALRVERARVDPRGRLADLSLYWRVEVASGLAPAVADAFNDQPWVEIAYPAFQPQPPPADIPPETPDLTDEQLYVEAAPVGFGALEREGWPGARGEHVAVADLEYSWERGHEDLEAVDAAVTWGSDIERYRYHGNGVLGILFAGDNGYGVTGLVPEAEPVVIFPYDEEGDYNVAAAIDAAAAMLDPGDVLVIEQQAYANGSYCPVEIDPAVFDAISLAVAAGIVVVEPAGNGGQDLDAAFWGGWFDRELRDSGAVMVGGGASPISGDEARGWVSGGSCYGSRVDVQGWYSDIVTTGNGEYDGYFADLFFPDGDGRQAYTSNFGGTSGASPQVAAVAAAANSASIELRGEPLDPLELRALMISTGTPQPDEAEQIGPQPDLRRLLRYAMLP